MIKAPPRRAESSTPEAPLAPSVATSLGAPSDDKAAGNRKLIRPQLAQHASRSGPRAPGVRRRSAPPEATGAEAAHYQKQANLLTPQLVTLESGEVLHGTIEWHDRDCIKLRRTDGPSVLVMKQAILHTSRDPAAASPRGRRD